VDEQTLESARYALSNRRDTIGNSDMQMLAANLEIRVVFLGAILMIPVMDQGVTSFINQLRVAGKKIVCLVEGLSPQIKLRVKSKDSQSIHNELTELTYEMEKTQSLKVNTIPLEL